VSEGKPSSPVEPIQGFTESFKFSSAGERILSPTDMDYLRKLRVSAWSVRWVLSVRHGAGLKRVRVEASLLARATTTGKDSYVIYRRQMLQLLHYPKPAFDQLAIELPTLMGFRAKEVTTWRAEHIDWVNGDTLVLDAKKHRLCVVPLSSQVARHTMDVLGNRAHGYVLQSRSNRQRDPEKPLTPIAVWYIWSKWVRTIGVNLVNTISPIVGRRFFAAEWYYSQGLSLVTLQRILRHTDVESTIRYVAGLVFHEDVKRDYDRFQLGLMQEEAQGVTA